MKKTIFLLAAGVMALTACTSTDVIEEGIQGNAIGFKNFVGKESRAIATTTDLTNFYVYGYYTKANDAASPISVFDGDKCKKSGDVWATTNTRFWVKDATYYFYAYSCENTAVSGANGNPGMNLSDINKALILDGYVCHNNAQGKPHDLIYATNDNGILGLESGNVPVPMKFYHILSKLNIEFSSAFPAGYDIAISDVVLSNYRDKGTYNPKDTSPWTSVTRTTDNDGDPDNMPEYKFAIVGDNIASAAVPAEGETPAVAAKTVKTDDAYVIPFAYTNPNVKISFKINVTNKNLGTTESQILSTNISGSWQPNWVIGTAYTYKVSISGGEAGMEKIEFSVATEGGIEGWKTPKEGNLPAEIKFSAK